MEWSIFICVYTVFYCLNYVDLIIEKKPLEPYVSCITARGMSSSSGKHTRIYIIWMSNNVFEFKNHNNSNNYYYSSSGSSSSAAMEAFQSQNIRDYLNLYLYELCPTRFLILIRYIWQDSHFHFSLSFSLTSKHTHTIIHSFGLPSLQSLNMVFISIVLRDDLVLWSNQLDNI